MKAIPRIGPALRIDPDLQALIPPLSEDEHQRLLESLRAEACRDALVVWRGEDLPDACPQCGGELSDASYLDGDAGCSHEPVRPQVTYQCGACGEYTAFSWTLLDGHHRYAICQSLRRPFRLVEAPDWVMTKEDATQWVIQNQLARRNLEPFQRAELALKLEPLIAAKAKEREREAGREKGLLNSSNPIHTRAEMAKAAHVSEDTIRKAKVIESEADEPTKAALRQGERSIHSVYQDLQRRSTAVVEDRHDHYLKAEWFRTLDYVLSRLQGLPRDIQTLGREDFIPLIPGASEADFPHILSLVSELRERLEALKAAAHQKPENVLDLVPKGSRARGS